MQTDAAAALADDLALAQRAALAGADLGRAYFARVSKLPQELKADGTIVTEADRAVEQTVRDILLGGRPADACLGEETGAVGNGRRRWVLDGIDGTAVFVRGDGRWQTLIALEEDGRIVVGVAVLPAQGKLWWASRGAGAFVADFAGPALGPARRLAVSPPRALPASRLAIVPLLASLPAVYLAAIAPLLAITPPQDWSAHPALLVASGEFDLAVHLGGQLWDYAALAVIAEEAGGVFSRIDGPIPLDTKIAIYANTHDLHAAAIAHLTAR